MQVALEENEVTTTEAVLKVGDYVINYHSKNDFKTHKFEGLFAELNEYEISELRTGMEIFVDFEQADIRAVVYGYVKCQVVRVQEIDLPHTTEYSVFYHQGDMKIKSVTTEGGICKKLNRAVDEKTLVRTMERYPLSKVL